MNQITGKQAQEEKISHQLPHLWHLSTKVSNYKRHRDIIDNLPATPLPIVTKALQNPSPVSTFIFKLTSMNGGAEFPRFEGWKVTPQNAGIVHSLTVYDWAFRNHQPLIQSTQNDSIDLQGQ